MSRSVEEVRAAIAERLENGRAEEVMALVDALLDNFLAAVTRVRAIHKASTDHAEGKDPYCLGCWEGGGYDGADSFPCSTIRALEPWQ